MSEPWQHLVQQSLLLRHLDVDLEEEDIKDQKVLMVNLSLTLERYNVEQRIYDVLEEIGD
ncbi:MAG: hypothetical protein CML60_05065 [Rhodobacteraceae bacterium]|nr:hypothetical protein [Paracoccaceae bacterium]